MDIARLKALEGLGVVREPSHVRQVIGEVVALDAGDRPLTFSEAVVLLGAPYACRIYDEGVLSSHWLISDEIQVRVDCQQTTGVVIAVEVSGSSYPSS